MNDKTLEGLEKALQYGGGEHNVGDVIAKILANEAQLWQAEGALIVTEIHLTPRKKVLATEGWSPELLIMGQEL